MGMGECGVGTGKCEVEMGEMWGGSPQGDCEGSLGRTRGCVGFLGGMWVVRLGWGSLCELPEQDTGAVGGSPARPCPHGASPGVPPRTPPL